MCVGMCLKISLFVLCVWVCLLYVCVGIFVICVFGYVFQDALGLSRCDPVCVCVCRLFGYVALVVLWCIDIFIIHVCAYVSHDLLGLSECRPVCSRLYVWV